MSEEEYPKTSDLFCRAGDRLNVSLWYPRIDGCPKEISIDLVDVRATPGLVIWFDFDRDGWVVCHEYDTGAEEDKQTVRQELACFSLPFDEPVDCSGEPESVLLVKPTTKNLSSIDDGAQVICKRKAGTWDGPWTWVASSRCMRHGGSMSSVELIGVLRPELGESERGAPAKGNG